MNTLSHTDFLILVRVLTHDAQVAGFELDIPALNAELDRHESNLRGMFGLTREDKLRFFDGLNAIFSKHAKTSADARCAQREST